MVYTSARLSDLLSHRVLEGRPGFPNVRASNEGLLRPRVARVQGIARSIFFLFPPLLLYGIVLEGMGRWSSTARIEGPQFYRGASASKESHLPTSSSYFSYFSPPSREGTGALAGHPCLLQLRPSNEALLRARVPGAREQHGCPATLRSCISFRDNTQV